MDRIVKFELPKVDNTFYVYFDIENGKIVHVVNKKRDDETLSFIETTYEDVKDIISGTEDIRSCKVVFNTKLKLYELTRNSIEQTVFDVNDLIYKIEYHDNADIQIVQDLKNTCWKFLISEQLRNSLAENKVSLKTHLSFSITEKDNPNLLYRTLSFPFSQLVNEFYVVLDFKDQYEFEGEPISMYTIKRFDTYSYEVNK